ncbi:type II secretion system protein [bacterium]|nr:type II secretion system protein [bacterium]
MKKALTIGELLVTMAIIGIIASLVLPSFMKDYHSKLYTARLKKMYEMVETAVNQACVDNNVSYFAQTPYSQRGKETEFLEKYFKKAPSSSNTNPFANNYRLLSGSDATTPSNFIGSGLKLQGGEAIYFYCQWSERCVFRVDINSTDAPNIMGRDFFTIALDINTNKLGDVHNSAGEIYDPNDCNANSNSQYGYGCLERIIRDNWTMNY